MDATPGLLASLATFGVGLPARPLGDGSRLVPTAILPVTEHTAAAGILASERLHGRG